LSTTAAAAASGARSRATSNRKPSPSTTPTTTHEPREQRPLEVEALGGGAADQRAGRERGAQIVDRRSQLRLPAARRARR
jgi:hypothetical protein